MSAFVIFDFDVIDEWELAAYTALALPTVTTHGGRLLVGGPVERLHGSPGFRSASILEFEDRRSALAWSNSPEYQALLELRSKAIKCSVVLVG